MDNIGPPRKSRGDLEAEYAAEKRAKKRKKKTKRKVKKMVKPIKPEEITTTREDLIPDGVIEAFNEMIVEKWDGKESYFKQSEIVTKIQAKTKMKSKEIFDKHCLDIEKIYKELGWDVKYSSPSWGESFDESFTFSKREKNHEQENN